MGNIKSKKLFLFSFFSPKPIVVLRPEIEGQKAGSNRSWDTHTGQRKFIRLQKKNISPAQMKPFSETAFYSVKKPFYTLKRKHENCICLL